MKKESDLKKKKKESHHSKAIEGSNEEKCECEEEDTWKKRAIWKK